MSKHHAIIYRNLASLNESGVDLRKSLSISNCGPRKYQKAMDLAAETVKQGGTIAEGLRRSPGIFKKQDVDVIAAAEMTGSLPYALKMLATEHENRRKLIFDLLGRFTYTLVLFHAVVLVFNFILCVVNKFDFSGFIPGTLLGLSILYVPLLTLYLIITRTPAEGPLRYLIDRIAYSMPGLRGAIQAIALSRFARIINLTYRAGMNEENSIKIATSITGNAIVSGMFRRCIAAVREGKPVSEGFSRFLPRQFTETWKVGELAGTQEATTAKLADIYQEEGLFKLKAYCSTVNFLFYLLIVMVTAGAILYLFGMAMGAAYKI